MREKKVLEAVTAMPGEGLDDLVLLAYDDTPEALHGIARRSLLAHLDKLEGDGQVKSVTGGGWQLQQER